MLVNHYASMLAYARKLKNVSVFGASDAKCVNSQRLYTLAKVLRVFYQKTDFKFYSTSIYQTSIVCPPFNASICIHYREAILAGVPSDR